MSKGFANFNAVQNSQAQFQNQNQNQVPLAIPLDRQES